MSRCSTCPDQSVSGHAGLSCRIVSGAGPTPCPILFLGAGPGPKEQVTGIPYTGKAGEEWENTYLRYAGLERDAIYVSNASQCWDGTDRPPSEKRVVTCARYHLPALLDRVRPEVLVLMGGVTQKIVDRRVRIDMEHGVPFWGSVLDHTWEGWVWPMYEPALGMRETGKMTQLIEDFTNLGRWWRGEWTPPVPDDRPTDYKLVQTPVDFAFGPSGGTWHPKVRWAAVDTETHGGKPWSVQWSQKFGQGRMVLAEDEESLALLRALLPTVTVLLHNAPQDLDTLERMGIRVNCFRDTMQEAYHLAYLPQGLKPLAFRLFGVTMRSWEDVVLPASTDAVLRWMKEAVDVASVSLTDTHITPLKRGRCVDCGHQHSTGPCRRDGCGCPVQNTTFEKREEKAGAVEAILRHVMRYTDQTREADDPYDPWQAVARMKVEGLRGKVAPGEQWEYIAEVVGPMPILGIANADQESQIAYAVGDADMTGQVAAELERLRGGERWQIAEEDRDQ